VLLTAMNGRDERHMKIILLGGPGAGKGTQGDFICAKYGIPKISTGDMLRSAVAADSALGRTAKIIMDEGGLVSDDLILDLIKERTSESDCRKGFLFDGFPRTIPQARGLEKVELKINKVIEISVNDEEIVNRLSGRRLHTASGRTYHVKFNAPRSPGLDDLTGEKLIQRDDDKEDTVRNRLRVYHEQTKPLIKYYSDIAIVDSSLDYITVDGVGSVEEIRRKIFINL
jgi:adenylate kinase